MLSERYFNITIYSTNGQGENFQNEKSMLKFVKNTPLTHVFTI